jgi:hypothetical protein
MPEAAIEDIRDTAGREPQQRDEDTLRVPSPAETTVALDRAQRALHEIRARDAEDRREAAEHRAEQLAQWHVDDTASAADDARLDCAPGDLHAVVDDVAVLEYTPDLPR